MIPALWILSGVLALIAAAGVLVEPLHRRRLRMIAAMRAEAERILAGFNVRKLEAWVGLSHGRGLLPRGIKVYTRAKYWHVKIRIGVGSPRDLVCEASFSLVPWKIGGVRVSYAHAHNPRGTDWHPIIGITPEQSYALAIHCLAALGAAYSWNSGLRFVPFVRVMIGDREGRRDRPRFNCSKFGLVMLRAIGLEPIPRMQPFRCAPGHFVHSAILADPVTLDAHGPELVQT